MSGCRFSCFKALRIVCWIKSGVTTNCLSDLAGLVVTAAVAVGVVVVVVVVETTVSL